MIYGGIILNQNTEVPEFNGIVRDDVLNSFKSLYKEHSDNFARTFQLNADIHRFLQSKVAPKDYTSKEYYTSWFNVRVRDHFSSALMLISQGFIVDALSVTRGALEDLLVVFNFYIDQDYFAKWHENKKKFKIRPAELRDAVRKHSFLGKEDGEFFDNVYAALSNIVHPTINSLTTMAKCHPTFQTVKPESLQKYIELIVLAFYTYELQLCEFLKNVYPQDIKELDRIINALRKNTSINIVVNQNADVEEA